MPNLIFISQISDIHILITKIINILMPIILLIATAVATVMTTIIFISGMKDIHGIERKEKVKRLIWVWTCYAGVFITSTIVLCITNLMHGFI